MTDNSEYPLALPTGTELAGDYVITGVIGGGGFGITYKAKETALDRSVTIKEYFPGDIAAREGWALVRARSKDHDGSYAWGLKRFIQEAKAIARFNHNNIVKVLRYFKANNTAFMVLQYEEGQDFKIWLDKRGRLPEQAELEAIIVPLLEALETIHAGDFLHRDIAPDNIIIRNDGSPVLIDFGAARSELTFRSKTVSALIKSGYSPFEQYAKTGREQGPWTDIYSLGATLYHAVTGTRPVDALTRLVRDDLTPAATLAKGAYDPDFLKAIDHALQLQIKDRPQSIDDWRVELFPHLATIDEDAEAPQQSADKPADDRKPPVQKAVKPVADRAVKASASTLFGQVSGAATGLVGKISDRAGQAGVKLKTAGRDAAAGLRRAGDYFGQRTSGALARIDAKTRNILPQGSAGGARENNRPRPRAGKSSLMSRLSEVETQKTPTPPTPPPQTKKTGQDHNRTKARIKKTKNRQAAMEKFAHHSSQLRSRAASIGRAVAVRPSRRGIALVGGVALAVGGYIYMDRLGGLFDNLTMNGTRSPGVIRTFGSVKAIAILPDGTKIVSAGSDRTIRLWDAVTGRPAGRLGRHHSDILALAVQGDRLLSADAAGGVILWDIPGARQIQAFNPHLGPVWSVAFIGKDTFVTVGQDRKVKIWQDIDGTLNQENLRGRGHANTVHAVAYSAERQYFATAGADGRVKLWGARKRRLIRTYRAHKDYVSAIAIAPDGRTFATGSFDRTVKIWPSRSRRVKHVLEGHRGRVTAVAYSPDGKYLASGSEDKSVRLWDVESGRLVKTYEGHSGAVRSIVFSPDGARIYSGGDDRLLRIWPVGPEPAASSGATNGAALN